MANTKYLTLTLQEYADHTGLKIRNLYYKHDTNSIGGAECFIKYGRKLVKIPVSA